MSNTTDQGQTKKKSESKKDATNGNGANKEHGDSVEAATAAPTVEAAPVEPPKEELPTIDILPPEVQAVLRSFKDQISVAPPEIQKVVANFIFGSDPPQASPPAAASSPDVQIPITPPQSPPQEMSGNSPVVRIFPQVDGPAGFRDLPSVMVYTAEINGYGPLQCLAIDVLQWGSRPVIIAKSPNKVRVLAADGRILEIPPKTPFAIPAEGDLVSLIRPLTEVVEGAYEVFIAPSCIERIEGVEIVRYRVRQGTRIPKSAVWPPK